MGHTQPRTVSPTEAPVPATTDSAHMRELKESSKAPYAMRVRSLPLSAHTWSGASADDRLCRRVLLFESFQSSNAEVCTQGSVCVSTAGSHSLPPRPHL